MQGTGEHGTFDRAGSTRCSASPIGGIVKLDCAQQRCTRPVTRAVSPRDAQPGKLRELRPMFSAARIEVIDLDEAGIPERRRRSALEAFDSFEENALAKANTFARRRARHVRR